MKVTLTQKELIKLVNNYFKNKANITNVTIEVKIENNFTDIISIQEDSFYIGSFIEEKIKKGGK